MEFSPAPNLSQATNVPVYASLYNNTGLLIGWLDFNSVLYGYNVPQGQLTWIRKRGAAGTMYAAGLTNVISVEGSAYFAPPAGQAALTLTSNDPGNLGISGGNLATNLSFNASLAASGALSKLSSSASTNSLTGTVTAKTGLLTVTFGNGKGKSTTTGTGVVLQLSNSAAGYFLGTTNSGAFILQPSP
jgi:hypothetical protein